MRKIKSSITIAMHQVEGKRSKPSIAKRLINRLSIPGFSHILVICTLILVSFSKETCGDWIMRKLIEYNAIIIKIPDNKLLIFTLVCKIPSIHPARKPADAPKHVAKTGEMPLIIEIAATAAPVTKLPSTVKSGKSNILNGKY